MSDKNRPKSAFTRACDRQLVIRDIPMHRDTIYGEYIDAGWLLSKMDLAGGKRAFDYIRGRAVTVGIESMAFHKPVKVGDQVSIYTEIIKQGKSSLSIKIESWAQSRGDNAPQKVTEGMFTFVSIDNQGRPQPIDGKLTRGCDNKSTSKTCCKKGGKNPGLKAREKSYTAKAAKQNEETKKGHGKKSGAGKSKKANGVQKPPSVKDLNLLVPATDNDKNYLGDVFGGWILSKMDLACSTVAKRYAGKDVATVGLDAMSFHKPVKVGDVVRFYTNIEEVGRTSISISVEAWAERKDKSQEKVTEGTFTYVAFDKKRKPTPVSPKR